MKRRDAIKLLGAAAVSQAWPAFGLGQTRKIAKVGFLYPGLSTAGSSRLQAFREGQLPTSVLLRANEVIE